MHRDRVALGNLPQDVMRPPAGAHEVFRNDFKPIDLGPIGEDVFEMGLAQTKPQTRCVNVEVAHGRNAGIASGRAFIATCRSLDKWTIRFASMVVILAMLFLSPAHHVARTRRIMERQQKLAHCQL